MGGKTLTVLNRSRSKAAQDVDALLPFSESLQAGRMVQDVQNRNPAYLGGLHGAGRQDCVSEAIGWN